MNSLSTAQRNVRSAIRKNGETNDDFSGQNSTVEESVIVLDTIAMDSVGSASDEVSGSVIPGCL